MKHFFTLLVILVLTACASTQQRMTDVRRGMTIEQVKELLGTPEDRTFRGTQEVWTYETKDGDPTKVVIFDAGKVVELVNSDKDTKATHSLEKGDVSTRNSKNLRCVATNDFGKYAEGGGCNLYGCWAKGGYCNQFGCSSTGSCNARGCPQRVPTADCQD